ncbi:hypothetical protein [Peribacillus acanthi]|uniref:hypothetical protein n=1 Tax=Peribacillus acanthi TaxID=2171554 RepID=UPI000D3E083C|nr:hypothetical protein [Peribacillus acanthi]
MQWFSDLSPDFIKTDHILSRGLHASKQKQDLIMILAQYSKNKFQLILDRMEQTIDMAQARMLRVNLIQGIVRYPTKAGWTQ